ncbi:LysR family transcriptional regulator [Chromohalobacter sp. 11-W]|uniref:LysR family transcriptional regulator n=1 Tax=Chromohalobacter sp. 11-W TaxID=2994061 RepID=UPI00246840A3|nr:LysR family transcriptional regulator [Chromohalobacter sp. 11-W]
MMNLTHWRLIVAVADAGTISQAAERVGMTQSGASQAIAQMEKALGSQLFTRMRREASMTAFGELVVDNARSMLTSLDSIRGLAEEQKGLGRGRLRLGSFHSVISNQLPPLLTTFHQRHPGIEVIALEGTDEEVEAWLASGAIDLGVVLNPTPDRQALILGRDAWVVLVPASHLLARRASAYGVDFTELATQPFIHATGGCTVNAQSLARDAGVELTNIRVTVRDWASACALVREGMGIAVVPECTLPRDRKGLRALPLTPPIYRQFGLVTGAATPIPNPIEAFWQHVEKTLKC